MSPGPNHSTNKITPCISLIWSNAVSKIRNPHEFNKEPSSHSRFKSCVQMIYAIHQYGNSLRFLRMSTEHLYSCKWAAGACGRAGVQRGQRDLRCIKCHVYGASSTYKHYMRNTFKLWRNWLANDRNLPLPYCFIRRLFLRQPTENCSIGAVICSTDAPCMHIILL